MNTSTETTKLSLTIPRALTFAWQKLVTLLDELKLLVRSTTDQ